MTFAENRIVVGIVEFDSEPMKETLLADTAEGAFPRVTRQATLRS